MANEFNVNDKLDVSVGTFKTQQPASPGTGGAAFKESLNSTGGTPSEIIGLNASSVITVANRHAQMQAGGSQGATASVGSAASGQAAFGAGAMSLPGSGGGTAIGGGSFGNNIGGAVGSAAGGDSQQQLLQATREMQEGQMSFNLQYLQLQSQMQHENRSYTAVSNIMKTKHDTVKNSISNVR